MIKKNKISKSFPRTIEFDRLAVKTTVVCCCFGEGEGGGGGKQETSARRVFALVFSGRFRGLWAVRVHGLRPEGACRLLIGASKNDAVVKG